MDRGEIAIDALAEQAARAGQPAVIFSIR